MEDLVKTFNRFLNFNEFKLLKDKGEKSHKKVLVKVGKKYDQFNKTQKIISDFDKQTKGLKK